MKRSYRIVTLLAGSLVVLLGVVAAGSSLQAAPRQAPAAECRICQAGSPPECLYVGAPAYQGCMIQVREGGGWTCTNVGHCPPE